MSFYQYSFSSNFHTQSFLQSFHQVLSIKDLLVIISSFLTHRRSILSLLLTCKKVSIYSSTFLKSIIELDRIFTNQEYKNKLQLDNRIKNDKICIRKWKFISKKYNKNIFYPETTMKELHLICQDPNILPSPMDNNTFPISLERLKLEFESSDNPLNQFFTQRFCSFLPSSLTYLDLNFSLDDWTRIKMPETLKKLTLRYTCDNLPQLNKGLEILIFSTHCKTNNMNHLKFPTSLHTLEILIHNPFISINLDSLIFPSHLKNFKLKGVNKLANSKGYFKFPNSLSTLSLQDSCIFSRDFENIFPLISLNKKFLINFNLTELNIIYSIENACVYGIDNIVFPFSLKKLTLKNIIIRNLNQKGGLNHILQLKMPIQTLIYGFICPSNLVSLTLEGQFDHKNKHENNPFYISRIPPVIKKSYIYSHISSFLSSTYSFISNNITEEEIVCPKILFPSSLTYLSFGNRFNSSIARWKFPDNLEIIDFGSSFKQSLNKTTFPHSIKEIWIAKPEKYKDFFNLDSNKDINLNLNLMSLVRFHNL